MNDYRSIRRDPPRSKAARTKAAELAKLDPASLRAAIDVAADDVALIQMPDGTYSPKSSPDILNTRDVKRAIAEQHRRNLIGGSQ